MSQGPILTAQEIEEQQRSPRVGSVAATIAILRLLATISHPLGVNAIARKLGLTPSSCFNILKTLVAEDFIDFDSDTKVYSLGGGMVAIARRALDPNATFDLIRNRAEEFADDLSVTVGLWRVVRKSRMVLVGYTTGAPMTRIHLTVGQRIPALVGATGRCVAARSNLTDAEIALEFSKLRWQEQPTLAEYMEQVEHARRHGWAVDDGKFLRGVTSIATPVTDASGAVRYCLSLTMFAGQHRPSSFDGIAQRMLEISAWAAQRLSNPALSAVADPKSPPKIVRARRRQNPAVADD